MPDLLPGAGIETKIFLIRGLRVMIDRDLAELYQVPTKALNQAVKRNRERFPEGFMFELTQKETQEVVTNCDHLSSLRFSHAPPLAFTEYGVAMLSSVLRSRRAVRINVEIVQAFIRLREWALTHKELARKIDVLERQVKSHDRRIKSVFDAIRELMQPPDDSPPAAEREIGFKPL
jgi:hypothetical protein